MGTSSDFNATRELELLGLHYNLRENQDCGCFASGECKQPVAFLQESLEGLDVISYTKFGLSSTFSSDVDSIINTPFVSKYSQASDFRAVFYLLQVNSPGGQPYDVLIYAQTVLLLFGGLCNAEGLQILQWPHVTVGVLRRSP